MDALLQPELVGVEGGKVAVRQSLEIAMPAKDFEGRVAFTIAVARMVNGGRVVVQRIPERQVITLDVPGSDFPSQHWNA